MTHTSETRRAGGATGLNNTVCLTANNIELTPNPPPPPVAYFLREIAAGADLKQSLEEYSQLPADFIKAYRGDRFGPALHVVDGGRP